MAHFVLQSLGSALATVLRYLFLSAHYEIVYGGSGCCASLAVAKNSSTALSSIIRFLQVL